METDETAESDETTRVVDPVSGGRGNGGTEDRDEPVRPQSSGSDSQTPRLWRFAWFAGLLTLAYAWVLYSLAIHAADHSLHSHVLLIPFVSAYLIFTDRARLPGTTSSSPLMAAVLAILGAVALVCALTLGGSGAGHLSQNDFLALSIASFLCFLTAGGFWFLGKRWMAEMAFPVAFLVFMIPLPDAFVVGFENFLMAVSADASDLFFSLSGIPYVREGQIIELSTITLEVAQECSGIRATYVLFITSLLGAYMILRSPWRRALFVAVVIPLGILRNGFRILVIGLLCVNYGPHMIDHFIHKKGGPFFFALSLIPLFLLLWWLRATEEEEDGGRRSGGRGRRAGGRGRRSEVGKLIDD